MEREVKVLTAALERTKSTAASDLSKAKKELVAAVDAVEENWEAHDTCLAAFVAAGAVVDGAAGPYQYMYIFIIENKKREKAFGANQRGSVCAFWACFFVLACDVGAAFPAGYWP